MKRTELKRRTPLARGEGPKRKSAPRPSQPKRDWTEARAKVEREEVCRLGRDGGCEGRLEAAHIVGRDRDQFPPADRTEWTPFEPLFVAPDRIVPLCTRHHRLYDAHQVDLLGFLTPWEEAQAVLDSDGLELARRRLAPNAYNRQEEAEPVGAERNNPDDAAAAVLQEGTRDG